ncbi:MAG: hypothetical protein AAFY41_06885, partial [Bacteroidota bacterium]
MNTIYLIAISQGFLLILFLGLKKHRNQANMLLAIWVASICLSLGSSYLLAAGIVQEYPHLLGIDIALPLLCGPFLYLYVGLVIGDKENLKSLDFWHFSPFLIYLLILWIMLYSKNIDFKLSVLNRENHFMPNQYYFGIYAFSIFQAFIYSIKSFRIVMKTKLADINITYWLKGLIGFMLIVNTLFLFSLLGVLFPESIFRTISVTYLSISFFF